MTAGFQTFPAVAFVKMWLTVGEMQMSEGVQKKGWVDG